MSNDMANVPMTTPPMQEPDRPTSFFQIWLRAITQPRPQTYADIASSPNARATTGFIWVFLAAIVQALVSAFSSAAGEQLMRSLNNGRSFGGGVGFGVATVVCGAPIAVLVFAALVGIIHLIAKAFGGKATYDQLAYTTAAIYAPLLLVSAILSLPAAIPGAALCLIPLGIAVFIYMLVLMVISTAAVHRISGGGSAVSVLAPYVILCVCVGVVAFLSAAALGPIIGNVFSSINNSLQNTP